MFMITRFCCATAALSVVVLVCVPNYIIFSQQNIIHRFAFTVILGKFELIRVPQIHEKKDTTPV